MLSRHYVDITVTATGVTLAGNASVASEVTLSQLNIGEFDNDNEYAVIIQNAQKRANFRIQKVDTSGRPLVNEAASFTVTGSASASGTYVNLGTIQTDVITGDAMTAIQTVPYGTYTITETVAPNGYRLADDTFLMIGDTVTATGSNVFGTAVSGLGTPQDPYLLKIQDEQTGYNLTLRKIAEDEPVPEEGFLSYTVTVKAMGFTEETSPAGKTYNLIQTDSSNNSTNGSITFNAEGEAVVEVRNGYAITLRSLPGGSYTVTEADGNYSTHIVVVEPSTSHTLKDVVGRTVDFTLSTATTVTITNIYGVPVKILKTDQAGQPLAGAHFSLAGGNVNELSLVSTLRTIQENDLDVTEALIYENSALPMGTYTLTETGTPAGYLPPDAPVSIRIESGETGITVTASMNGKEIGYPNLVLDHTTGEWTLKLTNTTGYALPSIGGPGTAAFHLPGLLLTGLAGIGLVLKGRRKKKS